LEEEFPNNKENIKVNKKNFSSKKIEIFYKKDKREIYKKG
jgi:hypothetical protein